MKLLSSFLFCFLYISTNIFSQSDFREEYQKAITAYESGDYHTFMKGLETSNSLRPNHRVILYNLAVAYVMNDMHEEALSILEYRASFYAVPDFDEDEDFKPIRNRKEYKGLIENIEKRNKTISSSTLLFELEEKGFHTEGIAVHPKSETIFISDVRCGLINTISIDGTEKENFMDLKKEGFWGAFGMKIDPIDSNILWVTTSVLPQFCEYNEEIDGSAAVLKIDITKKEILQSYTTEGDHIFGDLTISESGDVFITDSNEPVIYILKKGSKNIESYLSSEKFFNLQGLDLGKNGYLYVSDYIRGILKIDLSDRSVQQLLESNNQLLRGTDGMYFANNSLILLQNGTSPVKVSRISIDKNGNAIPNTLEIIDSNAPFLNEPTLGAVFNNKLYFVANSPWSYYDVDNKPMLNEWPVLQIRTASVD